MADRDFQFADRTIRVEASAADLDWLEEFLAPQFVVRRAAQPDQRVRLIVDADQYAKVAALGPQPYGPLIDCFTLDRGIVTAPVWNVPGDGAVAFHEAAGVFYRRLSNVPRDVEVLAAHVGRGVRVALMRIVREFAMQYAERAGWLIVHAAAVGLGDDAFVIIGPKQAGKTTLLAHMLLQGRGTFIANDRVALCSEGEAVLAAGIPTIVSMRLSSSAWFPALQARLAHAGYHHRFTLAESHALLTPCERTPGSNWSLSPRQFCDLVGVESKAAARVTALLFPSIAPTVGSVALEELASGEALARLSDSLFRRCSSSGMFKVGGGEGDRGGVPTSPAQLLAQVPSFVCRLGPDAYQNGMGWLEWLCQR